LTLLVIASILKLQLYKTTGNDARFSKCKSGHLFFYTLIEGVVRISPGEKRPAAL